MLRQDRIIVICALCNEAILSREDLFTVSLWFRIRPYHADCYEKKFRDPRKRHTGKSPVNSIGQLTESITLGFIGLLIVGAITYAIGAVLRTDVSVNALAFGIVNTLMFAGPFFIPAAMRYSSWIRFEKGLPR